MLTRLRLFWKLWGVYDHAEKEAGMTGKSLLMSKTFWLNILMGGLQVADWAAGTGMIPQPYGVAVQSIVNILLRLVTSQPITSMLPGTGPAPSAP